MATESEDEGSQEGRGSLLSSPIWRQAGIIGRCRSTHVDDATRLTSDDPASVKTRTVQFADAMVIERLLEHRVRGASAITVATALHGDLLFAPRLPRLPKLETRECILSSHCEIGSATNQTPTDAVRQPISVAQSSASRSDVIWRECAENFGRPR